MGGGGEGGGGGGSEAKEDIEGWAGVLHTDGHATCKCIYAHKYTYTYAQDLKRLDCPFRSNQATGSNPL